MMIMMGHVKEEMLCDDEDFIHNSLVTLTVLFVFVGEV